MAKDYFEITTHCRCTCGKCQPILTVLKTGFTACRECHKAKAKIDERSNQAITIINSKSVCLDPCVLETALLCLPVAARVGHDIVLE